LDVCFCISNEQQISLISQNWLIFCGLDTTKEDFENSELEK